MRDSTDVRSGLGYTRRSQTCFKTAASVAALCCAATAFAQSKSASTDTDDGVIVVTGNRSFGGLKASDSPAPIQVLSNDVLKRTGQPDLVQSLAQNLPSVQAQAFASDQAAFHLQIKLRGLNPNHTLILLNGKRRHGAATVFVTAGNFVGSAAPDIGLIPPESIDHIEVLQDGAAAQYGTDAIAGVINIIQKKSASGGSLTASAGQYMDGGGRSPDLTGNIGFEPFANAYLNLSGEYRRHGHSNRGDLDPRVVNNGFSNSSGAALLRNYPSVVNAAGYPYVNKSHGDAEYDLGAVTYNAGYEISPDVEFYSFGSFAKKVARGYQNYRLPNVVVGKAATDVPFPQGFTPVEATYQTDFATTAGLSGDIGGTTWDLSSTYGSDLDRLFVEDSANASLYLDSSTATSPGVTPRYFKEGALKATQWTNTLDLTRKLDIGLAEPINLAAGLEYRHETYETREGDPSAYYKTGSQGFFGYAPINVGHHSRDNLSQYVDISIRPFRPLLIDGAVRHEHYNDFGDTTVGKLTARFDFSPAFAIRGTAATGFRAPTLAEEYYSGISSGATIVNGIFAPNSAGSKFLGISGLKPEKSTNFSVGFVAHPISRLTATLDLYSIKIRDRIVQSGTFFGYNSNPNVIVSPSVIAALTANGLAINPSVFTASNGSVGVQTFVNGANTRTRGADFVLTYATPLDNGANIDWSLTANYNDTKILDVAAPPSNVNQGVVLLDANARTLLTDSTPKWRVTAGAFATWGPFSINLRESYYGPSSILAQDALSSSFDKISIHKAFITDLDLGYRVTKSLKISIGANNLFNHYPTKNPDGYRAAQYQASAQGYVAQYPTFSPFGINGGYYYGKVGFTF